MLIYYRKGCVKEISLKVFKSSVFGVELCFHKPVDQYGRIKDRFIQVTYNGKPISLIMASGEKSASEIFNKQIKETFLKKVDDFPHYIANIVCGYAKSGMENQAYEEALLEVRNATIRYHNKKGDADKAA